MTLPVQRSSSGPVSRWNPSQEFEDLYTQMGRLWESVFGSGLSQGLPQAWTPLVDVCETEDSYIIKADVPGVKRDDLAVEVVGNELTVTGELKETEREGLFRRRTRRVGRFEYRTSLPRDVDADKVEAQLVDGVLTLRVPKAEAAKPRKIEING